MIDSNDLSLQRIRPQWCIVVNRFSLLYTMVINVGGYGAFATVFIDFIAVPFERDTIVEN